MLESSLSGGGGCASSCWCGMGPAYLSRSRPLSGSVNSHAKEKRFSVLVFRTAQLAFFDTFQEGVLWTTRPTGRHDSAGYLRLQDVHTAAERRRSSAMLALGAFSLARDQSRQEEALIPIDIFGGLDWDDAAALEPDSRYADEPADDDQQHARGLPIDINGDPDWADADDSGDKQEPSHSRSDAAMH